MIAVLNDAKAEAVSNTCAGSEFNVPKNGLIHRRQFQSQADAQVIIRNYIAWFLQSAASSSGVGLPQPGEV
jgi:hypothetical protein